MPFWRLIGALDYEVEYIETRRIRPPHEVRDDAKLKQLVESMKSYGWIGRPLLAEQAGDENQFQAWTGSHRLAAAKKAGLEEIPVVLLDDELIEASELVERGKYGRFWDSLLSDDEKGRLALLKDAGEEQAADLLKEELDANRHDR